MNTYMILGLVAIGLYLLTGNKSLSTAPVFVDMAGNVLGANVPVGTTISLNVPGYTQVWLTQTKNGTKTFDGGFNVPEAPYTLTANDKGTYVNSVYALNAAGTGPGTLIGTLNTVVS